MKEIIATTAGVLLAAGRGRRMGRLKQLLPWGDSTVVAAAFDALAVHCGAGMVLVVGDDADRIMAALTGRTFCSVESDSEAEQMDSVRVGLQCALGVTGPKRVLLHPADHPVIPPSVIEALLRRATECNRVLIPTCRGRGGHPVLIPADVAQSIVSWKPDRIRAEAIASGGGLRAYWKTHADRVRRIEFPDAPEVVMDLDSPGDYAAMLQHRR